MTEKGLEMEMFEWKLTPWWLRLFGYPKYRRVAMPLSTVEGFGDYWLWEYEGKE